jgi:2-aminoadipate transaminase
MEAGAAGVAAKLLHPRALQRNKEVALTTQWDSLLSNSGRNLRGSAVRELFKLMRPGMISFGGGMPAPETFPCEAVEHACIKILREQGPVALQYGQTAGYIPLRDYLAEVTMAELGLHARRDNILVITGGLQADDLLPKVLVDPGDPVVVEDPTFLGALASFAPYRPRYITIPLDGEGMRVDLLKDILTREKGVKLIYTIPNFHNPAGCTMSLERRQKLVALADTYGIPILEDDPYHQLRFSGEPQPALITLDQERVGRPAGDEAFATGNVIYTGSFSKILSPGIRLGWVCGPVPILSQLERAKQGVDLHTSLFIQMIAYELCQEGFFPAHIEKIRALYRRRRDLMMALMREHFPPEATYTVPDGGLFLWVTLPPGCDTQAMMADAIEAGVAFVPGPGFYATGGGENAMRLNFSNANEEQMPRGIALLGEVLKKHVGRAT